MPPSPLSGPQRDALMQHLDGLFALAQVVTPNADAAARLVEATFQEAFSSLEVGDSDEDLRVRLYALMMNIRRERADVSESRGGTVESEAPAGETQDELRDLRRRLAAEYVDRVLPAVFATLPSEQRVLLTLCDIEGLTCEEAARVLGMDPAASCAHLEAAHAALQRSVLSGASDAERRLLPSGASDRLLRDALRRMADAKLVVVPPTLRPSVASIFRDRTSSDTRESPTRRDHAAATGGTRPPERRFGFLKKLAAIVTLIAAAGMLGYAFTRFTERTPDLNLISITARQASSVEASFHTTSSEQAERYIYDRLGSRVTLPTIEEAALQGVTIRSVVAGADVPVVVFQDVSTSRPIAVYVYSYAFLDRHAGDVILEQDILRQIESEGNFDLHDLGEDKALVWRNRDDIFIAITRADADALRSRISFPS